MLLEGQIFDNTYRLLRLIGEGGMGAVYEATHARLAGRYAIKVLLKKLWEDPEALARFHREARITSLLQHPNVVEVIDYNTAADGTEYLVMEYLPGESLGRRLHRVGPLPLDTVVGIIDQVAAGLAAAHAHGIVHRDLKPDNVFLVPVEGRESESVKILDFGISKVKGPTWGDQAPEGMVCGTPQYMAPEQVEGRVADVDAATDQFALAVLAYEMLTGRSPFQGDSAGAIFSLVLNSVPAPTGIGWNVDAVLRRGMAKATRRRFSSVTEFADAFRSAATAIVREVLRLGTSSYAIGEISRPARRTRARRSSWGLTMAATIVASLSMSFVARGPTKYGSSPAGAVPAAVGESRMRHDDSFGRDAPPHAGRRVTQAENFVGIRASSIGATEAPRETARPTDDSNIDSNVDSNVDSKNDSNFDSNSDSITAPRINPKVVTVPARAAHRAAAATHAGRSSYVHPTSTPSTPALPASPALPTSSVTSRPRSAIAPGPVDDDAILPLDETPGTVPVTGLDN